MPIPPAVPQAPTARPEEQAALRSLYPELTPEQLQEAAYYLKRYLDWIARVAARQHDLTDCASVPSMGME